VETRNHYIKRSGSRKAIRVGKNQKIIIMITQKEFMEIVEKHLIIRDDGSVYIKDSELAKKYGEYLKQYAKKDEPTKDINAGCANIYCPK